jgi:putative zinc finger/helix-turn-helix YgiT family protein
MDYPAEVEHDGRPYSFIVPNIEILECEDCHNRVLPDVAFAAVMNKLRAEAGLLTPIEIREKRKHLGLTQEQFANYLNVAKETVSRWETGGQIQQRVMNDFMRAFFDLPSLREYLRRLRGLPIVTELATTSQARPSFASSDSISVGLSSPVNYGTYLDIPSPSSWASGVVEAKIVVGNA